MAVARCTAHPPTWSEPAVPSSTELTEPYTQSKEPEGYPNLGLVCGQAGCREPAVVWLTENEAIAYHFGDREFSRPAGVVGFRVK